MKVNFKKCKECKEQFLPQFFNQKYCFKKSCREIEIKRILDRQKRTQKKEWSKRKRETKERLKTRSERLNDLQKIFNKFIRLRDKGNDCISCGNYIKGVKHASHYKSQGGHSMVRYNEDNVFVSCYRCNVMLSGNLLEYRKRLIDKIGLERVEKVERLSMLEKKWSLEEIEILKEKYKQKIKELQ
jgi:hypothetical protein